MTRFIDSVLSAWANSPGAQRLESALLQFVWQAALFAAIAALLLVALKRAQPQVRYLALLAIFAVLAACPAITFLALQPDANAIAEPSEMPPEISSNELMTTLERPSEPAHSVVGPTSIAPDLVPSAPTESIRTSRWINIPHWLDQHRHWIVLAWLAGVCMLSLRLLLGLIGAERVRRRGVTVAGAHIQQMLARLMRQMNIRPAVRVLESTLAEVPSLVGWLRPVILLPASALSGLAPAELEALLAHELAHVRRHDYLVNLLQTVIETILFYHPAVWWLSRRIRQEREHCCDDIAVAICHDRIAYARALTTLEELRPSPRWAIAARGGSLIHRIRRIIGRPEPVDSGKLALIAIAAVLTVVVSVAMPKPAKVVAQDKATAQPNQAAAEKAPAAEQREYAIQVVTTKGEPVVNATVTPSYAGYTYAGFNLPGFKAHELPFDAGSLSLDAKLFPSFKIPPKTDARGFVRIVISPDGAVPVMRSALEKVEITRIGVIINHPDHPCFQGEVKATPEGPIVLPDATTVKIRAHRDGKPGLAQNLYPIFGYDDISSDVSEADGVLTIRRVDLTTAKDHRWLRVVQLPPNGEPVRFSEPIDLKQYDTNPIALDVSLRPGVRVSGRLLDNVSRPVRNGRVLACMVRGADYKTSCVWQAATDVAPDGTFEFQSLPPGENLQLIALCDGWVSSAPSMAAIHFYDTEYGFPGANHIPPYQGPVRGTIFPRLYRLTSTAIQPVIPMEPTLSCEVTVLDQDDQPIEGANVFFQPNQRWFSGLSQHVGYAADSLTDIRKRLAKEEVPSSLILNPSASFGLSQKTDAHGIAVVSNLPPGSLDEPSIPCEYRFSVGHKDYVVVEDLPRANAPFQMLHAKILLGQTGKVTVRMQRK